MSAWVSPPQLSTSHIVVTAPSIAAAASTALPPFWNMAPRPWPPSGLPVMAIQCGREGVAWRFAAPSPGW